MTVRDLFVSLVRTIVPTVVGLILAALAKGGIEVDPTVLTLTIDALFVGGYYALVRLLESKWSWLGLLLGWKATPTYDGTKQIEG
jgi:hypothetical protein